MIEKLWLWGILGGNVYGGFHAVAGPLLYVALRRIPWFRPGRALLAMGILTVGWEVRELFVQNLLVEYGSIERWAYDTAGDLILEWLTILAVYYQERRHVDDEGQPW